MHSIAIASGKGGTGKTSLAVNLLSYWAGESRVSLIDLDVEAPNDHLYLKGAETSSLPALRMVPHWDAHKCSLCGVCSEVCAFNAILKLGDQIIVMPDLCHSCYACSQLCPEGALPMQGRECGTIRQFQGQQAGYTEGRLQLGEARSVPLIAETKRRHMQAHASDDWVIIDAPPGNACPLVESVRDADHVLLVTEPTPFGLSDLKLIVETMRILGKDFSVVVNKWGSGDDRVLRYCEEAGIPLAGKIAFSREVALQSAAGNLLWPVVPDYEASIAQIRHFLTERLAQ